MTARTDNKKQIEEIKQMTQMNLELQNEVDNLIKSDELLHNEIKRLNKDIGDMQKAHKNEIIKVFSEVDSIKVKWHSPDEYQKLLDDIQEADK